VLIRASVTVSNGREGSLPACGSPSMQKVSGSGDAESDAGVTGATT
jgi:hypothetical protein